MGIDVYEKVAKRLNCAKYGNRFKHNRHPQLFPATEPIDFIAMDILGSLLKTAQ